MLLLQRGSRFSVDLLTFSSSGVVARGAVDFSHPNQVDLVISDGLRMAFNCCVVDHRLSLVQRVLLGKHS